MDKKMPILNAANTKGKGKEDAISLFF